MTWEFTLFRPLMLIHALTGCGALFISAHVLYFLWTGRDEKRASHRARARRYAAIAWPTYLAALLTGVLTYPAYCVNVRYAWMQTHRPDLVGWFEIKEHWGAIGLLLAWAMWRYLCRSSAEEVAHPNRGYWRGQTLVTLLMVVCITVNVVAGIWIVMVRSVS